MNSALEYYSRPIFINNSIGRRQLKETLGNLLVGLIISPEDIWLVSPWISDFDLLDNRSGNWNSIETGWGVRKIKFSEVLIRAMESGCRIRLVTNGDQINQAFVQRLRIAIPDDDVFQYVISDKLHIKGLLASKFFLAGSMNFTYSGANINDEQVLLNTEPNTVLDARFALDQQYGQH